MEEVQELVFPCTSLPPSLSRLSVAVLAPYLLFTHAVNCEIAIEP